MADPAVSNELSGSGEPPRRAVIAGGVSHKTCPLEVRERLAAYSPPIALPALKARGFPEAVLLSTCNRFEVYAAVHDERARSSAAELQAALDAWAGRSLGDAAYMISSDAAVQHLFRVAGGLDSLVLGEAEILGQVKQAYEAARQLSMTGKLTNVLFQRAIYLGKKVRSDTGIAVGHLSVASVAVDMAERIFGSLKEREVLILGAGKMAELTSKHLTGCQIGRLFVANRTWERGVELARRFEGEAVRWEDFPSRLSTVDIVIGSTGADRPVVTRPMVEAARTARKGRSLFFIDIAMPRDIEDAVNELDHVYLYSLADLQGVADENAARRRAELDAAAELVRKAAAEFSGWQATIGTAKEGSLRHARPAAAPLTEET